MTTPKIEHSQVWLHSLAQMLEPWFAARQLKLPRVRISVGHHSSYKTAGTAHVQRTADGYQFIQIDTSNADPVNIGAILVHEMIHCLLPATSGHGKDFREMAESLGLEGYKANPEDRGKFTSTVAGAELTAHLKQLVAILGPYPHTARPKRKPLPSGPAEHRFVARCEGCHSKVTMLRKTYERGVKVICDNEECDFFELPMEIEEEKPLPKPKKKRKPTAVA